jgi:hypothetical protein
MFGQSFLVNRAVRYIAQAMDVDDDDAKALGTIAGIAVAILTLDVKGGAWTVETLGSEEAVEAMRDKWLDL